jgi:hypothetical protein
MPSLQSGLRCGQFQSMNIHKAQLNCLTDLHNYGVHYVRGREGDADVARFFVFSRKKVEALLFMGPFQDHEWSDSTGIP